MGHTPGGINNQQGKSSSSGRGYKGFGRGRITSDNSNGGHQNQNNSSSRRVNFCPQYSSAPPAASLPRFPDQPPSYDELEADPQAAQLLQQAMATLRRNRQQGEKGVVTVSIY